jgi:FAD/FMN-containing dehydrogenase
MLSAQDDLRRHFGGDIIEPGAPGYESARRAVFASAHPAWVLCPRTVDDVRAGVRFATQSGLGLSVRGGGHGFAGFATNDGGVVIDLSAMAEVEIIDEERHVVRIGGGAVWGHVAATLAPHGLAISSGDTKSVGVGGLTLAGGIGWKVRKYGLALDNVVGAEVVLADGSVVAASADENQDLFWALRGGGGNFGIVTSFDFAAHPTTQVFYGKMTFPSVETAAVLQGWADYLRVAPDELTSVVILANPAAGGPGAPVEIHVAVDSDEAAVADDVLGPIRRLGTLVDDDVALTPYADTLAEGASPPAGIRVVTRSAFAEKESMPEVLRILAEVSTTPQTPAIALRSVTGAAARVSADATAYAHRQADVLLVSLTAGPERMVAAATPALDALWERLAPHVSGAYANFLTSATEADVAAAYPPATLERLAAIKRQYDPSNVFARNHNVQPSATLGQRTVPAAAVHVTSGAAAALAFHAETTVSPATPIHGPDRAA